ncbi:YjbF family lipoprotein [Salipiger sp. 1_MG-2023]|uniref:YjbF family lipoprotein n=1 Tax=Salipiger sp. 1_MG-2023 TaxID=3062665 RepID=UPI0026E324B9|nr:YjbF family lipoprotein [Salipiger sp. 1_MG-2023]MDO6586169.1 YjbF family lipoprotein [Salipiger sp. 1_MG-2023]
MALLCALALAACSSDGATKKTFTELSALIRVSKAPAVDLRAQLTPEIAAQTDAPLFLLTLPQRDAAQALFAQEQTSGANTSWRSGSGEGIVLQGGVLQATRGLGGDLITADVTDVRAALAGRINQGERVHRHLDGEDKLIAEAYVCDYTRSADSTQAYFKTLPATRINESCTGLVQEFDNTYWVDGSGRVLRAIEWAGPAIGYIEREQLQ